MLAFLLSLGGRDQASAGLLPPGDAALLAGPTGGPVAGLDAGELARFERGRHLFDREFGLTEGTGAPRFNGDSCRACHFDPVIGGAGPRDVNVSRHGLRSSDGRFVPPTAGTILHRVTALHGEVMFAQHEASIFEMRQTPHLFGLGLIESIDEAAIQELADPDDSISPDGITGRVSYTDGGAVGRFGWKAQVPSIDEFVRDALSAELGLTVPPQDGLTFGAATDADLFADPEIGSVDMEDLVAFMAGLAAPARIRRDAALEDVGAGLFADVGCAGCHVPSLMTADGLEVHAYSDFCCTTWRSRSPGACRKEMRRSASSARRPSGA